MSEKSVILQYISPTLQSVQMSFEGYDLLALNYRYCFLKPFLIQVSLQLPELDLLIQ